MENLKHGNSSDKEKSVCYGIIGNIPKEFRSADLRAMFSSFIEKKGFECFHFRHRPEFRQDIASNGGDIQTQGSNTTCCIISILRENLVDLIKGYHGKTWVDRSGKYFRSKAVISKVRITETTDSNEDQVYKTRQEKRQKTCTRTNLEFSHRDLSILQELHPPHLMPNGNVGTPLAVFMELIRTCKLPPCVIKKLDLNFASSKFKKKYSNVPLDYKALDSVNSSASKYKHVEENSALESTDHSDRERSNLSDCCDAEDSDDPSNREQHSGSEILVESDDDNDTEEWDRHEALHNDVTSQERTKERLFEENIELKWEKGGSGLVFYTDAAFWKQYEEADFDEETADDWDVDMEVYENPGGGDKDSRDLLQMRLESQWEKGNDIDLKKIGGFEKHTRGFGGHLMKQQGWKEGESLGSSQVGITEPVIADGQLPICKRGLGYHGEKLQRRVKRPRAERHVIISTVYDVLDEQEVNLFQSWGPEKLKFVSSVDFVRAKSLHEGKSPNA